MVRFTYVKVITVPGASLVYTLRLERAVKGALRLDFEEKLKTSPPLLFP